MPRSETSVRSSSPENALDRSPIALCNTARWLANVPCSPASSKLGRPNSRYEISSVCEYCCFSAERLSLGTSSVPHALPARRAGPEGPATAHVPSVEGLDPARPGRSQGRAEADGRLLDRRVPGGVG